MFNETFYDSNVFLIIFIIIFILFVNFILKGFFLLSLNFFFIELIFRILIILNVLK